MTSLAQFAMIASIISVVLPAKSVHAQTLSESSWVSPNGNDGNQSSGCQSTAPCQSFQAALNATLAGGTISCIEPPFTPGPLTITQDVIIDCSGGIVTGDFIFHNPAITIASKINVILRGLTITGGETAVAGINVTAGATIRIEQCKIFQFETGVLIAPTSGNASIKVQDSTISRNSAAGVKVEPTGGATVQIEFERSQSEHNTGGGFRVQTTGAGSVTASIWDSSIGLNGANGLIALSGPSGSILVNLTNDILASNVLAGVEANQSAGGSAVVTVSRSTLSNNGSAWESVDGGTLLSFENNEVTGPIGTPPNHASFQ